MESLLAAYLMLVVAGYCAARFAVSEVRRLPTNRQVDVSHVLMATAMAGMFSPSVAVPVPPQLWQLIFVVLGVIFFATFILSRQQGDLTAASAHRNHGISVLAMIFMLVQMPHDHTAAAMSHVSMPRMTGHAMSTEPSPVTFAWLVPATAIVIGAYLLYLGLRHTGAAISALRDLAVGGAGTEAGGVFLAPAWPLCCEAAMALSMAGMTLVMV